MLNTNNTNNTNQNNEDTQEIERGVVAQAAEVEEPNPFARKGLNRSPPPKENPDKGPVHEAGDTDAPASPTVVEESAMTASAISTGFSTPVATKQPLQVLSRSAMLPGAKNPFEVASSVGSPVGLTPIERMAFEIKSIYEYCNTRTNAPKEIKRKASAMGICLNGFKRERQNKLGRLAAAERQILELKSALKESQEIVASLREQVNAVCIPGNVSKGGSSSPETKKGGKRPASSSASPNTSSEPPAPNGDGKGKKKKKRKKKKKKDEKPSADGNAEGDTKSNPDVAEEGGEIPSDKKTSNPKPPPAPKPVPVPDPRVDKDGFRVVTGKRSGPKPKGVKRRHKGDALIVKSDKDDYAEILKSMRTNSDLKELGAGVHRVRRSREGELILVLAKGASGKTHDYRKLVEGVVGEGVSVRAVTPETTVQCRQLDEFTTEVELAEAVEEQCQVSLPVAAIKLRAGPRGTKVASFKLSVDDANKAIAVGKIKVGWSVCSLRVFNPPLACYRCLEPGHRSHECKGQDRSKNCRRCGGGGHLMRDCRKPPECMLCPKGVGGNHITGSSTCPVFKGARPNLAQ